MRKRTNYKTTKVKSANRRNPEDRTGVRRFLRAVAVDQVEPYLPTRKSFFDPQLTEDLDLSKEVVPTKYDLPIGGSWFIHDFEDSFV